MKTKLPTLPSNAHYIQHENKCFDIGTIGWFLASGMIDKNSIQVFHLYQFICSWSIYCIIL